MNDNLAIWDSLKSPPDEATKTITGGRLRGFTDVSPQWRYYAMTKLFGAVGIGWWYTIDQQWIDNGHGDEKCYMTNITLYYKINDTVSKGIPGTGGSKFTTKETKEIYTSDEAAKMSLTDALSVAMKTLGVAANVYSSGFDFSKYVTIADLPDTPITEEQVIELKSLMEEVNADNNVFMHFFKIKTLSDLPAKSYMRAVRMLESKRR